MNVLVSDFDGTLATDDKLISERDYSAIENLIKKGKKFALCTGRMTESVKRLLHLFPDKLIYAAYNGGEIVNSATGEVYSHTELAIDDAAELALYGEERGFVTHAYSDKVYVEKLNPFTERYGKFICCDVVETGVAISEFIKKEKFITPKIQFQGTEEKLKEFYDDINAKFADRFEITFIERTKADFVPKGIDKGYALRKICDILGEDVKNAVAVGDDVNDVPMLKAAGIGVAPCSGAESAKQAADYVADSKNGGVIAETVAKFF